MAFFKKKIDWSKYTKQEEKPKTTPPCPIKSYPYKARLTRQGGYASFKNFGVDVNVLSDRNDDYGLPYEAMQICLLQDLREQLTGIVSRMDTLVEALNSNLEDDIDKKE